jgi:hypothetical protein
MHIDKDSDIPELEIAAKHYQDMVQRGYNDYRECVNLCELLIAEKRNVEELNQALARAIGTNEDEDDLEHDDLDGPEIMQAGYEEQDPSPYDGTYSEC